MKKAVTTTGTKKAFTPFTTEQKVARLIEKSKKYVGVDIVDYNDTHCKVVGFDEELDLYVVFRRGGGMVKNVKFRQGERDNYFEIDPRAAQHFGRYDFRMFFKTWGCVVIGFDALIIKPYSDKYKNACATMAEYAASDVLRLEDVLDPENIHYKELLIEKSKIFC